MTIQSTHGTAAVPAVTNVDMGHGGADTVNVMSIAGPTTITTGTGDDVVRVAHEEGGSQVAHAAASKGNDQVRMEGAIAALDPHLGPDGVVLPGACWLVSADRG